MTISTSGMKPELRWYTAMTEARRFFLERLIADAREAYAKAHEYNSLEEQKLPHSIIKELRDERCYSIASFYYLAREVGAFQPEKIIKLIDSHNRDCEQFLLEKGGDVPLKPGRKKKSSEPHDGTFDPFSSRVTSKILNYNERDKGLILLDKSDLCRFMHPVMSAGKCREALAALAAGGFFTFSEVYEQTFIKSNGKLEELFEKHLMLAHQTFSPHSLS